MEIRDKTAARLFPPNSEGISPYHPKLLLAIFVDPQHFFSVGTALGRPFNWLMAIWLSGLSPSLYWSNRAMINIDLGLSSTEPPPKEFLESWPSFWISLLVCSLAMGTVIWLIGGWWFWVRLLFAGDLKPDWALARLVYTYSALVSAIPTLLLLVGWNVVYANYGEACKDSVNLSQLLVVAFWFGTLYSSYTGARTFFELERARALIWFLAAPAMWYAVQFGPSFFELGR